MNLGDVFYWTTPKAKGHDSRPKYHIYVCPDDAWDDHTFLLINKAPWGDELKITKENYPFLQYDSYIGCNGVVTYTDMELTFFEQKPVGQINKPDLKALFNILADPLAMEKMQAKRHLQCIDGGILVCSAAFYYPKLPAPIGRGRGWQGRHRCQRSV